MSIYEGYDQETMEKMEEYMTAEKEDFELYTSDGVDFSIILCIIHELKATRHLICEAEYEYDKAKLRYDEDLLRLKSSEEYAEKFKTLKQREESALLELSDDARNLVEWEHQIRCLKANRDGLVDEVKFMYRFFEREDRSVTGDDESSDDGS